MGVYSAAGLAQGIGLEDNSRTPQSKQALQIAELNRQRNSGPVRNLRNEWSQMQQFYRLQRQVKADPNNSEAAKNLETQTKKVEGLEERIAMHEKEAQAIEDQILALNRPLPRKYRVAPVETGTCTGKIVFKGQPQAGAEVFFDDGSGHTASGLTNDIGACQLAIGQLAPFVVAGQYRVAVKGKKLPAKYSNVETSGLVFLLKSGKNEFVIELVD